MNAPIPFDWDGEVMRPRARFARMADRQFVVGETYPMVVEEQRSGISHRHFFASVHDAWLNLPDNAALDFANSDDLRKHALIMTKWRHERKLVLSSPAEARKTAAFMSDRRGEYKIISVAGCVVVEWIARSQKMRGADSMSKADFQRSKTDVLDFLAAMIGVEPGALAAQSPPLVPERERVPADILMAG